MGFHREKVILRTIHDSLTTVEKVILRDQKKQDKVAVSLIYQAIATFLRRSVQL